MRTALLVALGLPGRSSAQMAFQETFDTGVLSPGWVWQAAAPVMVTPDASGSGHCAGKASLNDVPPPPGELGSILFHDLPFSPGASYQIALEMRVENPSMMYAGVTCALGWWGPGGFVEDTYLFSQSTSWEWMQSTEVVPAVNTPAPNMRFGILLSIVGLDATGFFDNIYVFASGFTPPAPVQLNVRAWLDGPFVQAQNLMRDDLRSAGLLPTVDPYGLGTTVAPAVLAVTGNNAVVDWVRIDLRIHPENSGAVTSAAGLLQRDGDIVAADGSSPIGLNAPPGNYHVVVRHRNHLPIMSAAPLPLSNMPTTLDLRLAGTPTYLRAAPFTDLPRKTVGNWRLMWCGNGSGNDRVSYTGAGNDRDPILQAIGGVNPTATLAGQYRSEDVNLDGEVKYTGTANDRDPVLVTIGGTTPTATRVEQLP